MNKPTDAEIQADLAKLDTVISPKDLQIEFERVRRKKIIEHIAREFQVPRALAELRLKSLGLINTG